MNIIRASALGSCLKALVAEQLGYTPMDAPEKIQAAYDRGNEHEEACATALIEQGSHIVCQQQEVSLVALDGWEVVGHLDGRIIVNPELETERDYKVWEAKAPNAYDKFEKAYKTGDWSDPLAMRYRFQISAYMIATGLEAYVTSWDEERGVRGFGVELPIVSREVIEDRVREIAFLVGSGRMPELCTQADYPCPFYYLHEDAEEITEDRDLDAMVGARSVHIEIRDEAIAEIKDYDRRIREHLGGKDTFTESSRVTFYEQAAATRYDYDAMRADGIDVEKYKIAGKSSERMKITRRDSE